MNAELKIEDTNVPETVTIDECVYDAETGEFLGPVASVVGWSVQGLPDVEWVLGKMLSAEASLAAVMQSSEVLRAKAVLANAEKIGKEHQSRLDGLHRRFDAELGEYARQELEGKKTRTLKTVLGSISLKTVKGGFRVKDAEMALDWARTNAPQAIKVSESFQVSKMTDAGIELARSQMADTILDRLASKAFEVAPDRETVTVKTGVGA